MINFWGAELGLGHILFFFGATTMNYFWGYRNARKDAEKKVARITEATSLLEYVLRLRMHGEGHGDTWREADSRIETFLRGKS